MTKHELKTRNSWLLTLISLTALNFISNLIEGPVRFSSSPIPEMVKYFIFSFIILGPLMFSYLIYRCAYKNPGIKLLTLCIIALPISLIIGAFAWFSNAGIQMPNTSLGLGINLLSTAVSFWLYYLHFKMRAINKRLKSEWALQNLH